MNIVEIIDKLYDGNPKLKDILVRHSTAVADKAMGIVESAEGGLTFAYGTKVDIRVSTIGDSRVLISEGIIHSAAMLHDIGIIFCDAPGIECFGTEPYIRHGILGARYLREHCHEWGMTPEEIEPYARVCERHTGAGLTAKEIKAQGLPLPEVDLLPETPEEKLICYADKFFSKTRLTEEKSFEHVLRSMQKFGDATVDRFLELDKMFR